VEEATGFPLHDDLSTLLTFHDGCHTFEEVGAVAKNGYFFPQGHRFLSAREMKEQYQSLSKKLDQLGDDMVGRWWHPQWVPFAVHIAGDAIFVDHRSGPTYGYVGSFRNGDTAAIHKLHLGEFVDQFSRALHTSEPFFRRVPVSRDGRLVWKINHS
jgi:cell wall assembly regulator SMI1